MCVVSAVRKPGDCEVVFNKSKPTHRDAFWSGASWEFVKSPDYGGYANNYDRLKPYVAQLKRGKSGVLT